jgi:hypothetical protein
MPNEGIGVGVGGDVLVGPEQASKPRTPSMIPDMILREPFIFSISFTTE